MFISASLLLTLASNSPLTFQQQAQKQGLEVIQSHTAKPTAGGYLLTMLVRQAGRMYNVNCDYNQSNQIVQIYNAPIDIRGIKAACHHQGNDQLLTVLAVNNPQLIPGGYRTTMVVRQKGNPVPVNCIYASSGEVTVGKDNTDRLVGTEWQLVDNPQISLVFPQVGRLAGFGGCNRYFGSFTLQGSQLQIRGVASTKKACIPEVMRQEDNYFRSLSQATTLQLEGEKLTIAVPAAPPLVFQKNRQP